MRMPSGVRLEQSRPPKAEDVLESISNEPVYPVVGWNTSTAMDIHGKRKTIVNVEVVRKPNSTLTTDQLKPYLLQYVEKYGFVDLRSHSCSVNIPHLDHVESLSFCDDSAIDGSTQNHLGEIETQFHIFTLEDSGPELQDLDEKEDQVPAATHWQLPAKEFHGLWESLIYGTDIKNQLLNFIRTTMMFSDRGVDSKIISWNRVILLHGPPGTGKTSLCKALAQKIAIRLSHRYTCAQLVEINSHSLFSRWFSESGKLVMKMFNKIQELVEDPDCLVVVLIDEVESLARARGSAGNEPSDSIRVVNALLTQIDQIKRFPNVLILSTSNISGTIDLAFVDRADIKQYIGLPSAQAIYSIYQSCLKELVRTKFLEYDDIFSTDTEEFESANLILQNLAKLSEGLSGRTLRKIPFLASALYLHWTKDQQTLHGFLNAMEQTIRKQFDDRNLMPSS